MKKKNPTHRFVLVIGQVSLILALPIEPVQPAAPTAAAAAATSTLWGTETNTEIKAQSHFYLLPLPLTPSKQGGGVRGRGNPAFTPKDALLPERVDA